MQIFDAIIQAGALLLTLTEQEGLPPRGWPSIQQHMFEAYSFFAGPTADGGDDLSVAFWQLKTDLAKEVLACFLALLRILQACRIYGSGRCTFS